MITPRLLLSRLNHGYDVLSSYPVEIPLAPRERLKSLASLETGRCTADVGVALVRLHEAVQRAGGDLRVTELYRDDAVQRAARVKYERWLAAGSPPRSDTRWNAATMKDAFVAEPGHSFHNAGRAIDVHVDALRFPGLRPDQMLDKLWELAFPIGWRPVIAKPTEGASESWHFDYMGPWLGMYQRRKNYAEVAMCACLDIGQGWYGRDEARALQAQLHRAGYDVGAVDGLIGPKTEAALVAAGFDRGERQFCRLFELPDRPYMWSPT